MSDIKKYISEEDLLNFLSNYETWQFISESGEVITKNIVISPYSDEEWEFELEDGTIFSRKVVIR